MKKAIFLLLILFVPFIVFAEGKQETADMSPEEYFEKNRVTLIANGGVGGGTDFSARLFASYWSDVTGGAMVVKVSSGGGGIQGLNQVYEADPDGLTLGTTHHPSDMIAPKLLGTPGPKFDTSEFEWLGFYGEDPTYLYIANDAPHETVADLKAETNLNVGALSPGSVGTVASIVSLRLLDLDNADVVFGYEAPEMGLAAARGEILLYSLEASSGGAAVEKGYIRPFAAHGFDRTEWHPDTPSVAELAGDLTDDENDMLSFVESLNNGKSFFAPPGIDADKLAYLRQVFEEITSNPGFVKQAKVRWPVWQEPTSGAELEEKVDQVLGMDEAKIKLVRDLVQGYVK